MRRGEIWWASLPEPLASEPAYRRPVLIVQADAFNRSRIRTVLAVAISASTRLSSAPGNVLLAARQTGLSRDSVANVSQLVTVDKTLLTEKVGDLPERKLEEVETGLRLVLAL